MLGLVRQVRPVVLQLGDLRVRILRIRPVVVRALLLSLSIQFRQVLASASRCPRPAPVSLRSHGSSHRCRAGRCCAAPRWPAQRRRVHADRLALDQPRVRQPLQHPREDRFMRLEIDQAPRAGDRRNDPAARRATPSRETRAAPANPPRATRCRARSPSPRNSRSAAAGSSAPAAALAGPRSRRIADRGLDVAVEGCVSRI